MAKLSPLKFESMPNFRLLTDEKTATGGLRLLYRSSRPDFLTNDDIAQFRLTGIRAIIDFRSEKEYRKATGDKQLDEYYPVYKVKTHLFGKTSKGYPKFDLLKTRAQCNDGNEPRNEGQSLGKHYLIDFFKMNYIFAVYNRAPLWFKLYSLLFLLYDVVFNTGYRNFVKVFAAKVLNKSGLAGQYIDMLNHSQAPILAALKLLTDPNNHPAMINCAHGKDRTGIVSALILGCLGKSKEYIAQNYAMSEEELLPMKERVHQEIVGKFHMSVTFTTAKKDTMMEVLDYIEHNYGTITNYLLIIGFTLAEQDQLKRNMIVHS